MIRIPFLGTSLGVSVQSIGPSYNYTGRKELLTARYINKKTLDERPGRDLPTQPSNLVRRATVAPRSHTTINYSEVRPT